MIQLQRTCGGAPFCDTNEIPRAAMLGAIALESGADFGIPFIPRGLTDVIREVASVYGADVADTWGQIGPDEWVGSPGFGTQW